MTDYDELLQEMYNTLGATQIDFRYNRKTKTYAVVRLNSDPRMVLYKDGRARVTGQEEIERQLSELEN